MLRCEPQTAVVHYRHWHLPVTGEHVGEAQLHSRGDGDLWLWAFEVYPNFQGEGHGRAFLRALLHEAKCWGIRRMRLYVDPVNGRASQLYASEGFQVFRRDERGMLMEREIEAR